MGLTAEVLILTLSLIMLAFSSDRFVRDMIKISKKTRLKELTLGFIVLSVVTNSPEIAVTISSIYQGYPGISVGVLLGSNIVNVTLVLAVAAIIRPLKISNVALKNISSLLLLSSIIILSLIFSTGLSSFFGIILLSLFVFFVYHSTSSKYVPHKQYILNNFSRPLIKTLIWVVLELIAIFFSATYIVSSSVNIAGIVGISSVVFSATIISVATSVPELTVAIDSSKKGHESMTISSIIGSSITKLTLILGILLVFTTFIFVNGTILVLIVFGVISNLFVWYFMFRRKVGLIDRNEGITLFILFLVFLGAVLATS